MMHLKVRYRLPEILKSVRLRVIGEYILMTLPPIYTCDILF